MEYFLIFISAIFVNNIVLSQFLGICPFLGVSKKVDTALVMGGAVAFVLTLATIVTWLVQKFLLDPFGLQYLQTLAFILVIASLVQMVEIILKKVSYTLYSSLGIYLPLITTNCAILGITILAVSWYLPSAYYHQLCRARCGYSCHPERLQSAPVCGLCFLNCYRLRFGIGCVRRIERTTLTCEST